MKMINLIFDTWICDQYEKYKLQYNEGKKKTYLLQGRTHRPQHFSIPVKFFSASRMSALIWSIPSSMRSSCSVYIILRKKRRKILYSCVLRISNLSLKNFFFQSTQVSPRSKSFRAQKINKEVKKKCRMICAQNLGEVATRLCVQRLAG